MPLVGSLIPHVDARHLIGTGFLMFAFSLFRIQLDSQVAFRRA